jgi:hypothetical protein
MERLLFVLLFASALAAPASAEKRVALVVGNSTYKNGRAEGLRHGSAMVRKGRRPASDVDFRSLAPTAK